MPATEMPHDDPVKQGSALRARREALGLSQQALAKEAGSTDVTVRKIEKGLHVSAPSIGKVVSAITAIEEARSTPQAPPPPPPPDLGDLMVTVRDELRVFRRLYEDDRQQRETLAELLEALVARLESRP